MDGLDPIAASSYERNPKLDAHALRTLPRETAALNGAHVSDACSPARITPMAPESGLAPSFAWDQLAVDPGDGQPWDFNLSSDRRLAREIIESKRPT